MEGRLGASAIVGRRRPQLKVGELRQRMFDAGLTMVADAGGLTVSLAHLNMEEIIRLAGVPRSSVYREWDSKEDFYVELMIKLVAPEPAQSTAFDVETHRSALAVIDDHRDRLDTVERRWEVLREAIRVGMLRNFTAVSNSLKYQTTTALIAALPAFGCAQRERLAAAVGDAESFFASRMGDFYEKFLPLLGFRMRTGFSERQLALAGASVVEGMSRRSKSTPDEVAGFVTFPGIGGEPVPWHLSALTFIGVVEFMVEPIPDWTPPIP